MNTEDLFTHNNKASTNMPEMSVTDLANSLKKTLEQAYDYIRIRGELSGVKLASSGHLYGDIKDENAAINIVCWRGTLSKFSLKPEDGMDVIITGKISSYPKSSRYQIIIETIELAGEGALLKLLEDRRKKLAAEGLFDQSRKKKLPFLPEVIGVVTSPTGAVIQDILHRLRDRFPRHVLVWPVTVQGDGAALQIARAIDGFNALGNDSIRSSSTPKPDIIIVARGGGSLEDLMAFNEEIVVRAVANSVIPVISAVGHETDTTLIDFAADLRAPTPTGAAEMAVPVRLDLLGYVMNQQERLFNMSDRLIKHQRRILETWIAKLGKPDQLLDTKNQTLDYTSDKLKSALQRSLLVKEKMASTSLLRLRKPVDLLKAADQEIKTKTARLQKIIPQIFDNQSIRLIGLSRILESLSFKRVLERGYAVVQNNQGALIHSSQNIENDESLSILFGHDEKLAVKAVKSFKN